MKFGPRLVFNRCRYPLDCRGFFDLDRGDVLHQPSVVVSFQAEATATLCRMRLPSQLSYSPHFTGWTTPRLHGH